MRAIRHLALILIATSVPLAAYAAADVGTAAHTGLAITPSTSGTTPLVLNQATALAIGTPAYALVHAGGQAVVVMTPEGKVLTPAQAWAAYGQATAVH